MKRSFTTILAFAAAVCFNQALWAASPLPGVITTAPYRAEYLGEWYGGDYQQAVAWAEAEGIPVVMVWGTPGCTYCKKFDNEALDTPEFREFRQRPNKKMVLIYIKNNMGAREFTRHGTQFPGGNKVALVDFPLVLVYWKENGVLKAEQRFVGRSGKMPEKGGSMLNQIMNTIERFTGAYSSVPPIGKINMTASVPAGATLMEGTNSVITYTLKRESGTEGTVTAAVRASTNGLTLSRTTITWAELDDGDKTFTVEMPATTQYEELRAFTIFVDVTPPEAAGSGLSHAFNIRDQLTPKFGAPVKPANGASFAFDSLADNEEFLLEWPGVEWSVEDPNGNRLFLHWANAFTNGFFELPAGATNANAFAIFQDDIAMVPTNAVAGAVTWFLRAEFDGGAGEAAFLDSPVYNFAINQFPVFENPWETLTGYRGMRMEFSFTVSGGPVNKFTVTGLPAGLTARTTTNNTQVISGTPSKTVQNQTVTITAENNAGPETHTFKISILPMPANLSGKFNLAVLDGDSLAGTGNLTVGKNGATSAKAILAASYSFASGAWSYDHESETFTTTLSKSGNTLRLELLSKDSISGALKIGAKEYEVLGSRAIAAGLHAGYYTVAVVGDPDCEHGESNTTPLGSGYLTLNINKSGVRYSGKLADGVSASGATFLLNVDGVVIPVFKVLYSKRGYVGGVLRLEGEGASRTLHGFMDWENRGKASFEKIRREAVGAFFQKSQNLGAYYVKDDNSKYYLCADEPAYASLVDSLLLNNGQIPLARSGTTVVIDNKIYKQTSFKANRANGLFTGKILVKNGTAKQVSTTFNGILVKNHEEFGGAGYYLATETVPSTKTTSKRSYGVRVTLYDDCGCNLEDPGDGNGGGEGGEEPGCEDDDCGEPGCEGEDCPCEGEDCACEGEDCGVEGGGCDSDDCEAPGELEV